MMDFIINTLKWIGAVAALLIIGSFVWAYLRSRAEAEAAKNRKAWLIEKYGPRDGQRLADGEVWIGMTAEQVLDTLGHPDMVDQKQLKTKSREVYKWRAMGRRRIAYQITCDDGFVTAISDRR